MCYCFLLQERYADAKSLAFWMANSSELLHFLKSDRHISAFSLDAQDILADCVQIAFRYVRFEVLMVISMRMAFVWELAPHSLVDIN
jgi:hypothetical protein